MKLAPIVLFVYNRPNHTRKTLEALMENHLADQSELIIYADGLKKDTDENTLSQIEGVRKVIREKQWCKNVRIIESDENKGLAQSIIDGVTEVVNQYGRIIILEDDIVTSKGFLTYMNKALELYNTVKEVMHISAFMHELNVKLPETFFYNANSCWGWGTWKDRWQYFKRNPLEIKNQLLSFPGFSRWDFNKGQGNQFWRQIEDNINGKINTWAIFWHAAIYLNKGLCLHPAISLIQNIGHDNSGTHCSNNLKLTKQKTTISVNVASIRLKENRNVVILMYVKDRITYYKKKLKSYKIRIINKVKFAHLINYLVTSAIAAQTFLL